MICECQVPISCSYMVTKLLCAVSISVLTPADVENHVEKHPFTVPFVCGARNLGEALRRISEGAAMIRTKGEAGTGLSYCCNICRGEGVMPPWLIFSPGNVVEAVRHARQIQREIRIAQSMDSSELYGYAKQLGVPLELLQKTAKLGRLPVVNFAAGGLGKTKIITRMEN